jgi:hypothetical protein
MTQCQGLGRLSGHNYQPCYSFEAPSDAVQLALVEAMKDVFGSSSQLTISQAKTYHGHVCTRCGDVVNKQEAVSI